MVDATEKDMLQDRAIREAREEFKRALAEGRDMWEAVDKRLCVIEDILSPLVHLVAFIRGFLPVKVN